MTSHTTLKAIFRPFVYAKLGNLQGPEFEQAEALSREAMGAIFSDRDLKKHSLRRYFTIGRCALAGAALCFEWYMPGARKNQEPWS